MPLSAQEHAAVQARTRATRNAAARARRAAPVQLVEALDRGAGPTADTVLVALSRRTPRLGYILRPAESGGWRCPCPGYIWRGTCAHTDAATAAGATQQQTEHRERNTTL